MEKEKRVLWTEPTEFSNRLFVWRDKNDMCCIGLHRKSEVGDPIFPMIEDEELREEIDSMLGESKSLGHWAYPLGFREFSSNFHRLYETVPEEVRRELEAQYCVYAL